MSFDQPDYVSGVYFITKALEEYTTGREIAKALPDDEKPASLNGLLSVRNLIV
jgi:hypothetical protein